MTVPGTTYQELFATQGDSWSYQATLKLSQGSIAGSTIKMTVKRFASDEEQLLQISTDTTGVTIDDAENATFTFTKEQMGDLPVGKLAFDVEVTLPSGARLTPIKGSFNVEYQVTT